MVPLSIWLLSFSVITLRCIWMVRLLSILVYRGAHKLLLPLQ